MEYKILHNKKEIYQFLSKNKELQIYLIGDLDDFFWPKTIWYAAQEDNELKSLAMLYTGMEIPTLLAFCKAEDKETQKLLVSIKSKLPEKFIAHLSPGLLNVFGEKNILEYFGNNYKMVLKKSPEKISDNNIRQLKITDLPVINKLYEISYPKNWFDSRMLETGKYLGYFTSGILIGIAGIHVYSEKYKVAALGNICTHPEYRGQEIAFKLTSALCDELKKSVDIIGLNVKSDNIAAIKCYEKIGFENIGSYDECYLKNIHHG